MIGPGYYGIVQVVGSADDTDDNLSDALVPYRIVCTSFADWQSDASDVIEESTMPASPVSLPIAAGMLRTAWPMHAAEQAEAAGNVVAIMELVQAKAGYKVRRRLAKLDNGRTGIRYASFSIWNASVALPASGVVPIRARVGDIWLAFDFSQARAPVKPRKHGKAPVSFTRSMAEIPVRHDAGRWNAIAACIADLVDRYESGAAPISRTEDPAVFGILHDHDAPDAADSRIAVWDGARSRAKFFDGTPHALRRKLTRRLRA